MRSLLWDLVNGMAVLLSLVRHMTRAVGLEGERGAVIESCLQQTSVLLLHIALTHIKLTVLDL